MAKLSWIIFGIFVVCCSAHFGLNRRENFPQRQTFDPFKKTAQNNLLGVNREEKKCFTLARRPFYMTRLVHYPCNRQRPDVPVVKWFMGPNGPICVSYFREPVYRYFRIPMCCPGFTKDRLGKCTIRTNQLGQNRGKNNEEMMSIASKMRQAMWLRAKEDMERRRAKFFMNMRNNRRNNMRDNMPFMMHRMQLRRPPMTHMFNMYNREQITNQPRVAFLRFNRPTPPMPHPVQQPPLSGRMVKIIKRKIMPLLPFMQRNNFPMSDGRNTWRPPMVPRIVLSNRAGVSPMNRMREFHPPMPQLPRIVIPRIQAPFQPLMNNPEENFSNNPEAQQPQPDGYPGGANEFQEYAQGYYGIESTLISSDMSKVAAENKQCKIEMEKEEKVVKALSQPINVCVTNASSNVCYALLDSLCRGDVLGNNVEIIVHLFDTAEQTEYLEGVKMEAEDLSHGLLRGVKIETDVNEAFRDCSVIILLDEILQGENTKDAWIKQNAEHFVHYAKVIDQVAKKSVKVLVTGAGPINFNTTMMIKNAPSIPRQNFAAMSRLLENHSKSVIGDRLHVNTAGVVDVIVWGNPNGEHYIDVSRSRVHKYDGSIIGPDSFSVSSPEMVFDRKWLDGEYLELVKAKRSRSEEAMGHPATLSQAFAVNSTMMHWCNGSPSGQMFSLGVCSDGWYGIPKDMVFSFPVTFHPKGYWNVVEDIVLSEEVMAKIHETIKSLESELEVIFPGPKLPTPDGDVNSSSNQPPEGEDKGTESDQRLETIVEEKKEHSEEDIATATDGGKSTEEGEKTDGDKPTGEGEKTEDGENTEAEAEKKEEVAEEGSKEEQLPTE